jgi:hypothetical protein
LRKKKVKYFSAKNDIYVQRILRKIKSFKNFWQIIYSLPLSPEGTRIDFLINAVVKEHL